MLLFPFTVCLSQPTSWTTKGIGCGGAVFAPSISPFNSNKVFMACDMSDFFYSYDFGTNWTMQHYQNTTAFHNTIVRFTNDSNICYTLRNIGTGYVPIKSTNAGMSWFTITNPASVASNLKCYDLYSNPYRNDQIIVSDKFNVYISNNGGTSYSAPILTTGAARGLHLAGVFFDINNTDIYVCTNKGLILSTNGGTSFSSFLNYTGIDSTNYDIVSFDGAKQNGVIKFVAVTDTLGPSLQTISALDITEYSNTYIMRYGSTDWVSIHASLPNPTVDKVYFIGMFPNDTSFFYLGGQTTITFNGSHPVQSVYKTTNGGTNFTSLFLSASNINTNAIFTTGWSGYSDDPQFAPHGWYGPSITLGLSVDLNDKNRLMITNSSVPYKSTNAGATWEQAYVNPADQNPPGSLSPAYKDYQTTGLETTVCYHLAWGDSTTLMASFADLLLVRSTNSGTKWHYAYKGFPYNQRINDVSMIIKNPMNNYSYASTGEVLGSAGRWDDNLVDAPVYKGAISFTTDKGAQWDTLHNFYAIVSSICFDPNNPKRMFATVMNYKNNTPPKSPGGIYVNNDITANPDAFSLLTVPSRTQGRAASIQVLNDSTLVTVYTGRTKAQNNFSFTDSSGIFVSTDAGTSWIDRTQTGMKYFTHSLTIDPNDVSQNTWFACTRTTNFIAGGASQPGVWRTTNRGVNWTKIFDTASVRVDFHPNRPNEMYISTEFVGLYYATNTNAAPSLTKLNEYGFRTPTGVFFNPYNSNEVWITSLGNGLRVGYTNYALPLSVTINAFIEGSYDGANQAADTLTLYLKNSSAPYAAIDSTVAVINNLGVCVFNFTNTSAGSYYLCVKNRNTVETWSAVPVSINIGSNSYDFSSAQTSAYGSNLILKSGKWCFISGDLNQDGFVNGNDFTIFSSEFAQSGYLVSDLNSDGTVNGNDFTSFSNGFARQAMHP